MQGHRRQRETKRSTATSIRPKGWGGTGPSLCCSSSPMSRHRLVVAPRSGLRRAPNKRYRIYEGEYLGTARGVRMMNSIDPSVVNENDPNSVNPKLDMYKTD